MEELTNHNKLETAIRENRISNDEGTVLRALSASHYYSINAYVTVTEETALHYMRKNLEDAIEYIPTNLGWVS